MAQPTTQNPVMPPMQGQGAGNHPGPNGRAHLYVGNLSPRVSDHILGEIFAGVGPVLGVKLIHDKNFQHGGVNYGFVEYHDLRSAETAILTLNGRRIFDHEIKVNWAHQNNKQPQEAGSGREDLSQHFHVFVGDLSPEVTDEIMRKAFAPFGSLTDARVMWDLQTGKSRGYGFVAYKEKADAEQAITALNNEWLGSRPIRVNWANQRAGGVAGAPDGPGGPVRISNLPPFLGPPGAPGVPPPPGEGASGDGEPTAPSASAPTEAQSAPQLPTGPAADRQPAPQQQQQPERQPAASSHIVLNKPMTYDVVVQQAPPSNSTVYVGNLTPQTQQSDLVPLFQGFGYIVEIRLQAERGYAFVKLDTHQNAASAIVNTNGNIVNGRQIKCSWGKDKLGSDTSIIANQANGVTSPIPSGSPAPASQTLNGYAGWPYAFPYGQQAGPDALSTLSPGQASYFSRYYAPYAGLQGANGLSA